MADVALKEPFEDMAWLGMYRREMHRHHSISPSEPSFHP